MNNDSYHMKRVIMGNTLLIIKITIEKKNRNFII